MEFENIQDLQNWVNLYRDEVTRRMDEGDAIARRVMILWVAVSYNTRLLAGAQMAAKLFNTPKMQGEVEEGTSILMGLALECSIAIKEFERLK